MLKGVGKGVGKGGIGNEWVRKDKDWVILSISLKSSKFLRLNMFLSVTLLRKENTILI